MALDERRMSAVRGSTVSMVFQEPMTALDPVYTLGRQIGETLMRHEGCSRSTARARALELLQLVKVPLPERRLDSYPHELSGGLRQRALIAMALSCRPRLVLADEPTTALDASVQIQILLLLRKLQRELGMGLIFVTHDLGVAAQIADQVAVMYAGRIVEQAAIGPFFAEPLHPYSRGLLGARVDVDAEEHYSLNRLSEIPGSVGSAAGEAGCPFAPRCPIVVADCRAALPPLVAHGERAVACLRVNV
jgi:peptide/nickel transport system ATP-binding protein